MMSEHDVLSDSFVDVRTDHMKVQGKEQKMRSAGMLVKRDGQWK